MATSGTTDGAAGADPPFLDQEPPHWVASGLSTILVLLFVTAAIAAAIVQIPETVSGPFVLAPSRGTVALRAPREGIVSEIAATEGEAVARGQTLFVIQSPPASDRSAELRTVEAQLRGMRARAENARLEYEQQRDATAEEIATLRVRVQSLARVIALQEQQVAQTRELAAGYRGAQGGAVGRMEYSRLELDANRLAEQVEQARGQREEATRNISRLLHGAGAHEARYRETVRALAEEEAAARIRHESLARLPFSTADGLGNLTIPAPCDGAPLRLGVRARGAVVQAGDALGEFACTGDTLRGEVILPQSGVARVHPGQGVRLRYDAFPYQRYGIRFGTVRWVGPAGIPGAADAGAFRALVDVRDREVATAGTRRALMAGMAGRADVVVGRRSLASFAFEPIRQLTESVREGPSQ